MSADLSTLLPIAAKDPLHGRDLPARRPAHREDDDGRRFSDHLNERTGGPSEDLRAERERPAAETREPDRPAADERRDDMTTAADAQPARSESDRPEGDREPPAPARESTAGRDDTADKPQQDRDRQDTAQAGNTETTDTAAETTTTAQAQNTAGQVQTAALAPNALPGADGKPAQAAAAQNRPGDLPAKTVKNAKGAEAPKSTETPQSGNGAPRPTLALDAGTGDATSVSLTPLSVEGDSDLLPDLITVSNQTANRAAAQFAGTAGQSATGGATAMAGSGAANNAGGTTGPGAQQPGLQQAGPESPKGTLPALNPTPDGTAAAQIAAKGASAANPPLSALAGDTASPSGQASDPLTSTASGTGARDAVGKLSVSTGQPQFRMATAGSPPTAQIAMQLSRAAAEGQNRMSIQLQPAELGRVDVRLEVAADGKVMTIVAAERAETLDLLQRDQRNLEKALQDAGMNADAEGFTFLLDRGQDDGGQPFGEPGADDGGDEGGDPTTPDAIPAVRMVADGALDIRI